jgi:hypothetical protein
LVGFFDFTATSLSVIALWLGLTTRAAPTLEAAPDPIAILTTVRNVPSFIGTSLDCVDYSMFERSVLVDASFLLFFKVFFAIFFPSFKLPFSGSADLYARLAPLSLAILGGV